VTKGLEQFAPLIGEWTASSKTFSEGRGHMNVAPTEGGKFLRLDSREDNDLFPQSTQIIGSDEAGNQCTVLYHDERGVHRVYRTTLSSGVWAMWREAPGFNQRFIGKIRDGVIAGQWEMSEDGSNWKVDFDLTYTKVG
jgi:hypothetical protein